MPFRCEYSEIFVKELQAVKDAEIQKRVLETIKIINNLNNPKEKGGAYLKKWWVYPCVSSIALVCEIDEKKQLITFRSIIMNL